MDNSFASGESDPLADVALAWKRLQQAKAVLQRIEKKFYHQTGSCAKIEAARRKLWHGKSFDGEKNRDQTALNEIQSNEIPPACRQGNCAAASSAWSQTCFLRSPAVSFGPSQMSPLPPRGRSCSAPCGPARREVVDGEGTAGTWLPAKSLYRPQRDSLGEQIDSGGHTIRKETSPCSLHHPPQSLLSAVPPGRWSNVSMPTAVLLPTHHLSLASKPGDQKLEELWKKAPQNKLEQLKKKIQEQKRRAASQEKCLIPACAKEPLPKRALKRKVCKVMSAPPAPACRDQRERSSVGRIQTQSWRQPSPKSSALERAVTGKGVKLPGASAWREGQKLARKLLGPPPPFPNLQSTAEGQSTAKTLEPGRRSVATSMIENRSREKRNEPGGKSPEFRSCLAPPSKAVERGCSASTKNIKEIFKNLYLQSQYDDEYRHCRLPKDAVKGKAEVLQLYQGILSSSSGPQGTMPSAFSGEKTQSSLRKDGAKVSSSGNCSRGKGTSPQRQKGSSSPVQRGAEKENLKHPSKRRVNIKKPHPYSPEVVQEFMYQKNEERKKKCQEEKKALVQAMEMRNKRLQEVYRKQKAAVRKKTQSDQMHKLTMETESTKASPQSKPEQKQTSGGILESSFMAWVDKTSHTLLSKEHRDRNHLLETVQSPEKREELASPAALESKCCFLNPQKCEDLRSCSPPALCTPPLSFSFPQKDAKLYSTKDSAFSVSPYRSKQDRVKAIHSLSKELREKVEMATKRLNAVGWVKDSADKTETTLELFNESSSIPGPETLKDEQDRAMTVQMLLDGPDPDELCVPSDREFHGLGGLSFMCGTEEETALDRQKGMPTPLPGGVAVGKELPWTSHSTGQRHLNTGEELSNTLQGFPVNKSLEVDIILLHEKPITSPASPPPTFLARSLQRELTAQRNPYQYGTVWKVQHQEGIANQSLREHLRTLDSPSLQPSAPLSCEVETEDGFEQDFGEGGPSYTAAEEKHRSHLDNLRQTSLLLAHKLKFHQLQQKQQLTVLRKKAKRELQESKRFLSDLLQHAAEESSGSKGSCPSVPGSDCAEQTRRGHQSEGDNRAGSNQEMNSLKLPARSTGRDQSSAYPKMVGERKPLGGRGSHCSVLQEGSLPAEQIWSLLSPLNLPHSESCAEGSSGVSSSGASSGSQWSEAGRHYGGSSTFCHFSLAMAEQCLRGEELRARHQAALLKLRKKALRDKARAELAWLDHKKCCLENLQDSKGASVMAAKQRKILMELKQEQAEIQHLQNIYKAAHQERKLLLKQQKEILMMRHSTAQLQEKLHNLTGKQESQSLDVSLTRSPATEEPTEELKTMRLISSPKLHSSSAESTAHSERPDPSGNKQSCLQLENKQSRKYERFSTEKKQPLAQYQKQAEMSSGLEQSLGVQGPNASEMVAKKSSDAACQTTDSVSVLKACKTTVKEVEVPVLHEIHQVGGSQHLKHLEHISHEASDEELTLKAFPQGLASTESLCKSDNFSLRCESAKSDSSLSEFQKVSAAWIDISESSTLNSELELRNGEDTDVSIPEEFVYDNGAVIPHLSKETLTQISNGKEMPPSDKHNEGEVPKDDSTETLSRSQKCPGGVSDHSCPDDLLPFIPSDTASASKVKSADSFQSDNPAKEVDEPHLDASETYSGNKTSPQEITRQGEDAVASSSGSADIYSPKICEEKQLSSTTSRVQEDGGIDSSSVYPPTGSLKHLRLGTDPLRDTDSLPPDKDTANNQFLACLSSRNIPISGGKNNHAHLLNDRLTPSKLSASTPGNSEEVHTKTNSSHFLQRVATGHQNNSATERQTIEGARRGLSSSVSSKKQLFQAGNCSSKGEDETICISDEDLPLAGTLSEILSPVDEVLSYGSADLPSSSKKDLSFPSEDLPPPPPLGAGVTKNDGSTFSMEDFPPPPEQMTVSESRQSMDEDVSLKMGFALLSGETTDAFSAQDGSPLEQSSVKGISSAKEPLLEHQRGEHETFTQHLEFLSVSDAVSSGQASERPDFMMKQCKTCLTLPKAEEDSDDPLLSFEIGDRVLVKQTQPGTLMFKGQTWFDSGHWAGVALDKAEGAHAGTYKGVKYFECAQNCGVFVRPSEISHLIEANKNDSKSTGDEDSDSYDDESFEGDCKYSDDKQGGRLTEKKAEDTCSARGSEVKENQSRLHTALLSGKGQKLPHSDQCKCNEFPCQNNLMCLRSDTLKPELTQLNQRILANVFPMGSKTGKQNEVNTSKNICCLVEDQKRNKLADDIASELCRKLLLDTLIAFSATAQHKYKSAFEKDVMNYGKGIRQEDNQRLFLLKENSAAALSEQSAKVSDVLLCDFDTLGVRGCHAAAERIVTKFVDDAVKEYKKIKRKHGSKADKIFHSSSEISPTTLPLLIKILDAGVFGSSEDFDQPNPDQHVPVRQSQKQYLYKLDQWHSAPWKKTVEVPLVIPHHSSYVKKLSAHAVEELWTPENICSQFRRISVPKHFECNDPPGNDLEAESKRMYNQVIFDLTRELLSAECQVAASTNTLPGMKENLGSHCSRHLCRTDVSDVKMFVQHEIIKLMNLEKNDLEMKRKFLNMIKYGSCKRDRVDLILIQELCREESQWTYYDDDEFTVKMRMTEDIFDSLICDTIRVLNKIYLRKASD